MKLRKILCLVLAAVMLLSVLAACNKKPAETKPNETQPNKPAETNPVETTEPKEVITFPLAEPMTITVNAVLAKSEFPLVDNIAWKYMQELSGITFDTTEVVVGEAKEKLNLLMNSGEYGEMLFKASMIDYNQYGMDGLLLPLEDMIKEYMPNLCAMLDERNSWSNITAADGHVYALPNFTRTGPNVDNGMFWFINQSWLDKVGKKMPTSMEELYDVLKAFKEKDPNGNGVADEIPMAIWDIGQLLNVITYFDTGLAYSYQWIVIDGQLQYVPTSDLFKESLAWFAKFYEEGLINTDLFTTDQEKMTALAASSEQTTFGMFYHSSLNIYSEEERIANWVSLKPANIENFAINNGCQLGGMSLTDKCKNPEIILAFFDYLYAEEGGRIIRYGQEGVSYQIFENGTIDYIREPFENVTYQTTLMGGATVPGIIPDIFYDHPVKEVTQWNNRELYGEGYGVGNQGIVMPKITLTVEENDEYKVIRTDVNTQLDAYIAEVITGMVSLEDTWASFQDTLKAMDVERMVKIYTDAYNRAAEGFFN